MKIPFITKMNHQSGSFQAKTKKAATVSYKSAAHKTNTINNNIYRKFINFIDNLKTSSLPEDTRNIDSMF